MKVVRNHDRLAVLDELQRLDYDTLERLEERAPEAPRGRLAPVDACLQTSRARPIDYEIGGGQSIEGIEVEDAKIGSIEGFVSLTGDLHVLL
jgi:hypothetical protein